MLATLLVVGAVSAALVVGAVWGLYGRLTPHVEGFVVALAGGALMVSAVLELIEPATRVAPDWAAYLVVLVGAGVFVAVDRAVKSRTSGGRGAGLLAAITLDGVPENLALGVVLVGAAPVEVAALAGSILLSNLPEAAGGARGMVEGTGHSRRTVLGLWGATAVILAAAAVVGNLAFAGAPDTALALVQCFAGGAVVASLAVEVFPQAFEEEKYLTGVAAAIGLVLALALSSLA